ncbi:DsrE family protein [Pedobacter sp. Leaf132]|uniref:DsrE family protein n=1 Tax=Pedobacter sp. Leaf132 TaxID=2876557 RepID=UPI001E589AA4|nr:DsrE family protein [Pedobacter sp. Leaf132]
MKKITLICTLFLLIAATSATFAQATPANFTGAKATLKNYKALYVINNGDEKKIAGTLRNLKNALDDPRLKGKINAELIAFGDGVAVYQKNGSFEKTLLELQSRGVILAQCENTVRERKIEKNTLFDFISYVPSGNGEIIIRHYQGWAVVHP